MTTVYVVDEQGFIQDFSLGGGETKLFAYLKRMGVLLFTFASSKPWPIGIFFY